jgi:hypothetical protein
MDFCAGQGANRSNSRNYCEDAECVNDFATPGRVKFMKYPGWMLQETANRAAAQ